MKRCQTLAVVLGCALPLVSALVFLGCEVGSSDSVTRNVSVDFTGVYTGGFASAHVTDNQTGDPVSFFNLRQSGDQLVAIEDHGLIFKGKLGDASVSGSDSTSGFTLEGKTTAGNAVTIAGVLSGSSTAGKMTGTWIEPSLYGNVYATGQISPVPTNSTGPFSLTVIVSPTDAGTVTLSPSGGSYSSGTSVSLTATANTGHTFSNWSGDLSGTANPNTIIMSADRTVTANFN
jgi:hypothetical protein